jgi:hypothetical protein
MSAGCVERNMPDPSECRVPTLKIYIEKKTPLNIILIKVLNVKVGN